jgi:Uncharacterized protein conserved in archaea (DUF2180)
MLCYTCTTRGIERPAVATCRSCSAGLCLEHLRETAARLAPNPLSGCRHDTWGAPSSSIRRRTAGQSRLRTTSRRTTSSQLSDDGDTARPGTAVRASQRAHHGLDSVRAEV